MDNDTHRSDSSSGATGEQILDQLRGLRRSSDDKVLAGVCGGVARSLGIDPRLLRIIVAVMVLFAGTGIVLYALGWLLLRQDDGRPSVGAQVIDVGQHHPTSQTVWLAVILTVAIALGTVGAFGHWDGPILLSLAVVGLLVWLLRSNRTSADTSPPPTSAAAAAAAAVQDSPSWAATSTAPATPTPSVTGVQSPVPPVPVAVPVATPPPPPPHPPRQRSHLFGLTVSVALIGVGLLAAVDASGADLWPGSYPALVLAVIGVGLLVGAWLGRARGLIFWGLIVAAAMTGSSIAGHATRGVTDRAVDDVLVVTRVDQIPTADKFGAGRIEYNLSGLDVAGQSVSMRSQMGFGEIVVVVPPTVDVTVDARTGVGALSLFGQDTGGLNQQERRTDLGPDGVGGGTLDLTLYAGFGHLEVRRATS